jgi:hypothetical protein
MRTENDHFHAMPWRHRKRKIKDNAVCFLCLGEIAADEPSGQCATCKSMIFHRQCARGATDGVIRCACGRNLLGNSNPPRPVHDLFERLRTFRLILIIAEIAVMVYFCFAVMQRHCE